MGKDTILLSKYRIGDKVKIVDRMYGHGFEIGDIVEIKLNKYTSPFHLPLIYAKNSRTGYWLCEDEVLPMSKHTRLKII